MDQSFLRHEAYANLILAGILAVVAIVLAVKSRETSRLTIVCWLVASVAVMIVASLALQELVAPVWLFVSRYAVFGIFLWSTAPLAFALELQTARHIGYSRWSEQVVSWWPLTKG